MVKDIIIFGAGQIGQMALQKYADRVDYFIDNSVDIQGERIGGIVIKSVEEGVCDIGSHSIVIASKHQYRMAEQLKALGIDKYSFYLEDFRGYYQTEELVISPYIGSNKGEVSEREWNESVKRDYKIKAINEMVEKMHGKEVMFDHVEIETVNRCNGICSFCPVNKNADTREYKVMSDDMFKSIIRQLADLGYSGKLALFSNNEPFLDSDIIRRHQYAREKLPNSRIHLFTNGTLLNIEIFQQIMKYLDELIIDNYQQDLKLIKPCQEIAKYCEEYPELKKKVTIVLRKPMEILTTRGGDAPNRKEMISYEKERCVLPYKQLIIRPDGKVSLCCNDPLGKNTMGDLSKDSVLDIWNSHKFKIVREALYNGRGNWEHCIHCDNFSLG